MRNMLCIQELLKNINWRDLLTLTQREFAR
jgi:hypothetical protein